MKIVGKNIYDVKFTSIKDEKANKTTNPAEPQQEHFKTLSTKQQAVTITLSALAVAGLAALAINNLRKGKTQMPPIDFVQGSGSPFLQKPTNQITNEGQEILNHVNSILEQKPKLSPETIDANILGATSEQNAELNKLNNQYRHTEQWQAKMEEKERHRLSRIGQEYKQSIKQKLTNPTEPDSQLSQKIDNRISTMPENVRSEMTEYYTKMAETADKEAAMLKLKEENSTEYARLKTEKNRANRLAKKQAKQKALDEITTVYRSEKYPDGKIVKIETPDMVITKEYDKDGNIRSVMQYDYNKGKTQTYYSKNQKFTYFYDDFYPRIISKTFQKDEKGKYKLVSREIDITDSQMGRTIKIVHLEDDTTLITKESPEWYIKTIKNKKGETIYDSGTVYKNNNNSKPPTPPEPPKPREFADWYKEYLSLCAKYGVAPRECGRGGALGHYNELLRKDNDPDAYKAYLRIRAYRAKYDDMAKIEEIMDALEAGSYRVPLTKAELERVKELLKNPAVPKNLEQILKTMVEETEKALLQMRQQETMTTNLRPIYA